MRSAVFPVAGSLDGGRRQNDAATAGRIVLFLVLAIVLGLPVALLGIPGLLGSHLPLLVGSLLAGWFLLAREGRGPGALGFPWSREGLVATGQGLLGGTGLVLVVVGVMSLSGGIHWAPGAPSAGGALRAMLGVLLLLAVPAAAEEALLRGYGFQSSAEHWGWGWTLGWTSIAFALLHGANPGMGVVPLVNLVLAGGVLGLVVLRTGSLWWASGAHLGWNWGQAAVGLPVSGLRLVEEPALAPVPGGVGWWSGGSFGVEGSLAATLALAWAAGWLWRGGGGGYMRPTRRALAAGTPVLAGRAGETLVRKGLGPPGPDAP